MKLKLYFFLLIIFFSINSVAHPQKIHCQLTKQDLQTTYSYTALSCAQGAFSVTSLCELLNQIKIDDGSYLTVLNAACTTLAFSAAFVPVSYLMEKVVGSLTLRLARGQTITNKELLGFILYFEEYFKRRIIIFGLGAMDELTTLPGALAHEIDTGLIHDMSSRNATVSEPIPPFALEECADSVCQEECIQRVLKQGVDQLVCVAPHITVNTIFIPPKGRTIEDGEYMVGGPQGLFQFIYTIGEPIGDFAKQPEVSRVIFWHDDHRVSPEVTQNSRNALCKYLQGRTLPTDKVAFISIWKIPDVANSPPQVYSETTPIYWLVDLLRWPAALYSLEQEGADIAFYSDLDGKVDIKMLLTPDVIKTLDRFGVAFYPGLLTVFNGLFAINRDAGFRKYMTDIALERVMEGNPKSEDALIYSLVHLWWVAQLGCEELETLKQEWRDGNLIDAIDTLDFSRMPLFRKLLEEKRAEIAQAPDNKEGQRFLEAFEACFNSQNAKPFSKICAIFFNPLMHMPKLSWDGADMTALRRYY